MRVQLFKYLLLFLSGITIHANGGDSNFEDGVLDLRTSKLADSSVALSGLWKFYPRQLLSIHDLSVEHPSQFIQVPSWWTASDKVPSIQYATYKLIILLSKEDNRQELALDMPGTYSSYSLWIDGKLIGSNGKVGTTREAVKPQWKPQTYTFYLQNDTLEIVLHVSNFYHYRSGISDPIYLGDADKLISQQQQTKISGTILFYSLLIISMVSLGWYYMLKKKDKTLIYFAFVCISWALRSIFSNSYLAVQWYPDINWSLVIKIEYITLYLSTLFGSLWLGSLFPRDVNRVFRVIYIASCSLFTIFTVVAPPVLFTQFVQLYLGLSSILLLCMLIIISKAYIEGRQELSFLILSMMFGIIMFGYVILAYQGLFEVNALIFNTGFFLLFLFAGIATIRRLGKTQTTYDYDKFTMEEIRDRAH